MAYPGRDRDVGRAADGRSDKHAGELIDPLARQDELRETSARDGAEHDEALGPSAVVQEREGRAGGRRGDHEPTGAVQGGPVLDLVEQSAKLGGGAAGG